MMNNTFGGNDILESPSSLQQAGPQALDQMSDMDKFGLPGLLAMMHHPSADLRSLTAQGQDLTTLGLDLTSTEPLHTQLASVFNPTAHTRLPLDADYTLPACYRVANVQALHERIPSFSEETLFYIFYSSPKDLVQELVADELIGRKWRFHKGEKMWVTRDENYPAPVEVEREISEQGFYIWWDWKGWKKVRVSSPTVKFDGCENAMRGF
jgi:CCR4-NOT transcription complex subunit 2